MLVWGTVRQMPDNVRVHANELSKYFGLAVSIESLSRPSSKTTRYINVTLTDPETNKPVFQCRSVDVSWKNTTGDQEAQGKALVLSVTGSEVIADQADNLHSLLNRILTCRTGTPPFNILLNVGDLVLRAETGSQSFANVDGRMDVLPGGIQMEFNFRLSGVESGDLARLRIGRNRQTIPPSTGFELYTGDNALPLSSLAFGFRRLKWLGLDCRFSGYIWSSEGENGHEGEVTGRLLGLELDHLVTEWFPHKLSGKCQLTIHRARFADGRLESASGSLHAGPGQVSSSLLDSIASRLKITLGNALNMPASLVGYKELAFNFKLGEHGLQLQGQCTTGAPGVIMAGDTGAILGNSLEMRQPISSFLDALDPTGIAQHSATEKTAWLARCLPLNSGSPMTTVAYPRPREEVPEVGRRTEWP